MSARIYKPRWQIALLTITLPIWFIPGLIVVGWNEAGRDLMSELPKGIRYIFTGK